MGYKPENLSLKNMLILLTGLALISGFALLQISEEHLTGEQVSEESPSSNEFNRNDIMFMNMMIVHHDQAIEMAELTLDRTDNENILELSKNISEAQTNENNQMKEWMNQLGYQTGNHHPMAGMASEAEMQQLREANGSEYNEIFAELMIEHHEGGIAMAQNFYNAGENTELKQMQLRMIETQQKEIEKMRKWQQENQI